MTYDAAAMFKGRLWLLAALVTAILFTVLYGLTRSGPLVAPIADAPAGRAAPVALPLADRCVTCHHRQTPTIVDQWARSTHARHQATCSSCHEVTKDYPTAKAHYGTYVSNVVTPRTCATCHPAEAKQFAFSRHGVPAWTALVGYAGLSKELQEQFDRISEIRHAPGGGELPTGLVGATRNALYDLEGSAITKLACQSCHQVGRPNADGSAGNCNACHLRHDFSLAQVRKPETFNRCHIGPDHPHFEIYEESTHGILYHTQGHEWNWNQKPGRLGVQDMPGATCQVCHMSGFGPQPTTHDVGDRLSWFLFSEISTYRPDWQENRERMKSVCSQCHSRPFVDDEFAKGDDLTQAVNAKVTEAKDILEKLLNDDLITPKPFDAPIKYTAFDLWHHYGRTAKFGGWMQGPDYAQWHGIYPLMSELAKLKEEAARLREKNAARTRPPSS
jgi:hypothetical protein